MCKFKTDRETVTNERLRYITNHEIRGKYSLRATNSRLSLFRSVRMNEIKALLIPLYVCHLFYRIAVRTGFLLITSRSVMMCYSMIRSRASIPEISSSRSLLRRKSSNANFASGQ